MVLILVIIPCRGYAWEGEILKALENKIPGLEELTVYHQAFKSLAVEADNNIIKIIPSLSLTIFGMGIFLSFTAMSTTDWVRAKPMAAISGMLVSALGCLAGCGLLCYIGVPFIGINSAVAFIMLGIRNRLKIPFYQYSVSVLSINELPFLLSRDWD